MNPDRLRHVRPRTRDHLWNWVKAYTGVEVAREAVCEGHTAPFDLFAQQVLERPDWALWHGPRGSGKSFLSAIDTHIQSRFSPGHKTRILGGSKAQSAQIYEALQEAVLDGYGPLGSDRDSISECLAETARYHNGSEVKILAAGPKSARGPHVQSLKLDEVDEIDPKIRDAAVGMAMEKKGISTSILMTSTWHKPGGPMTELMEKGRAGEFPVHSYCVFEVLERCPEERSGPNLEHCPSCRIVDWCHADRDRDPLGRPKAKRSNGHYTIGTLIQKSKGVSPRAFKSDYLCQGPQVDGTWFSHFDESINVTPQAEYDPYLPVDISVDCGVHTGAIFGQFKDVKVNKDKKDSPSITYLSIFAEYYSFDAGAATAAREILQLAETHCGQARRRVSIDAAGGSRNPSGITVLAEYEQAGLKGEFGIEFWPKYPGCIIDGLNLTETFVKAADGTVRLTIHPRCRKLIQAFQSYSRDEHQGQWLEQPKDPQHPHEDMIDPVRGLLKLRFPESNRPKPQPYRTTTARRAFF